MYIAQCFQFLSFTVKQCDWLVYKWGLHIQSYVVGILYTYYHGYCHCLNTFFVIDFLYFSVHSLDRKLFLVSPSHGHQVRMHFLAILSLDEYYMTMSKEWVVNGSYTCRFGANILMTYQRPFSYSSDTRISNIQDNGPSINLSSYDLTVVRAPLTTTDSVYCAWEIKLCGHNSLMFEDHLLPQHNLACLDWYSPNHVNTALCLCIGCFSVSKAHTLQWLAK